MIPENLTRFVDLAIHAGTIVMSLREQSRGWSLKADGSYVTTADRAAEEAILTGLESGGVPRPIVAEERVAAGQIPPAAADFLLVDALDGTSEYVKGRSEFTVNIAEIRDGVPIRGVVIAPALAIGFAGNAEGAWSFEIRDGQPCGIAAISARKPPSPPTAVISRSHANAETLEFVARLGECDSISFGSSLKLCRIADGTADVYPRLGRTMEWDIAAGHAVLAAAGGHVLTLDGTPLRYGKAVQTDDAPYANPHFVAFGDWPRDDMVRLLAA